jgi:hypothetical protein
MAEYIYIPVMTGEMMAMATDWNQGRAGKGKALYPILGGQSTGFEKAARRKFGGGYLQNLNPADKLYVLAHGVLTPGSGGAVVIGAERGPYVPAATMTGYAVQGGVWKYYSAQQFARHLRKEGLPNTFVDLRLFCCKAGLPANYQGNQLQPYAQRLKAEMNALGYHAIVVTGYLGDLSVQYAPYYQGGTITYYGNQPIGTGKGIYVNDVQVRYRPKNFKQQF